MGVNLGVNLGMYFGMYQRPVRRLGLIGLSLASLMAVTGGVCLIQAVLTPQVAQAYKPRVDINLDRLTDESYQSLLRRAEIIARAAAQRSFDRDILAGEVSIMIMGRHNGTEAPLLLLQVSRDKWRERPDTRRWATYYRTTQALLKLPTGRNGAIATPGGVAPALSDGLQQEPGQFSPRDADGAAAAAGKAAQPPAPAPTNPPGIPLPETATPTPTPTATPVPQASPQVSPQASPTMPTPLPKAIPQVAPKVIPKAVVPKKSTPVPTVVPVPAKP
jgi:hypothetical protein